MTAKRNDPMTRSIMTLVLTANFFCYCLEDKDRGLSSTMSLSEIKENKVPKETAIPTGRYQITKYFSPKHGVWVPLLLHVPGFEFVEIHVGNYAKDTDGCLLLGSGVAPDMVTNSKDTVAKFYKRIFAELTDDSQVWITCE